MSARRDLATGLAGAAFGVLLGARAAAPPPPAPGPPPAPRPPPRVVCTSAHADEPTCADTAVRADSCAARVRALTRPRPTTAPPEAVGLDDPREWDARLHRALAACHAEPTVESTECAEYPCVSALPAASAAALAECKEIDLGGKEWSAVLPVPVDCGDGRTSTMWLFGILDQDALDALYPEAKGDFLPAELLFLGGRRAEALARDWPGCR